MGHASSKEEGQDARQERQTRRLSKPPTNMSSLSMALPKKSPKLNASPDENPPLDESMFWKSPWTGDLLPKAKTETTNLTANSKTRSYASLPASQPDMRRSLQGTKRWSSIDDFVMMKNESSVSRSSSFISRTLSRRSSMVQRPSLQSQPELVTMGDTRREPVIYIGPSDIGSHDMHSSIELMAADDRSPIEDSRALLGRRKSFRRPGLATRAPSWGLSRTPLSSIQQEEDKPSTPHYRTSQIPYELEEDDDSYMQVYQSDERATSPVALDYSHLSGFRRGTLRIVNVSPDGAHRNRPRTRSSHSGELFSTFASSQEKGTLNSRLGLDDDEAVVITDNTFIFDDLHITADLQDLEASEMSALDEIGYPVEQKIQSNTNADSGYNSVSSIHSGNSSRQLGSSPSISPVCSPARCEVRRSLDQRDYFDNHLSCTNKDISRQLVASGNTNPVLRPPGTNVKPPRYYSQLSPLCIPSLPQKVAIDERESDAEGSEHELDDDDQMQSPFSPILPKQAFPQTAMQPVKEASAAKLSKAPAQSSSTNFPLARSRSKHVLEAVQLHGTSPAMSDHDPILEKSEQFRGRTRSRSAGRARGKLVKSRKTAL